ncbi:SDR family oxidoreductase [Mesorhizobium escarrei]
MQSTRSAPSPSRRTGGASPGGPRTARRVLDMGVRLNAVCPGLTETGMLESFMQGAGNPDKLREAYRRAIPIGRLGKPDDISGAVVFLLSDDAEFITGRVLSVSGGLTMHG